MPPKTKSMLVLAGGMLFGTLLGGAPEAMAGMTPEMLSNTCAGCHGTNGVSAGPAMPTIAGMPAAHIVKYLQEFKKGERPSTIMDRIAKGYSDDEIKAIGGFFAKQKWGNAVSNPNSKMATPIDEKLVAKGKKLADKCEKCHEESGKTQDEGKDGDPLPRVAGQWLDYLNLKMDEYKDEKLKDKIPQPDKMRKAIAAMSLDDLKALSHFYASQK